jgi:hypothetical protein
MAKDGGVQDLYPDARSLKACVAAPPPSEWFKINIVLDTKRKTICHSKTLYGGDHWQAGGRSYGLRAPIFDSLSLDPFVLFNGDL